MKIFSYIMLVLGTGSLGMAAYYALKLAQGVGGLAAVLPLFVLTGICLIGFLFFGIVGLISFLASRKK